MKGLCLFVFLIGIGIFMYSKIKESESFQNIKPDISIDKYILKSRISPETNKFSDDKYILKTDIQPDINHIDTDKYILKSDIPPSIEHIDRDKYILKSEIPTCPRIDLTKYILKSDMKSDKTSSDSTQTPIIHSDSHGPNLDFGMEAYDSTDKLAELEHKCSNLHRYINTCNNNEWNMNKNYAY